MCFDNGTEFTIVYSSLDSITPNLSKNSPKEPPEPPTSIHHTKMAPSKDELNKIAADAERDLNSYQAKQGLNNVSVENAGVDSIVEKKFPGAEVKTGTEISTNAGYNRRIPPEEGGELDDRGRQVAFPNHAQCTSEC